MNGMEIMLKAIGLDPAVLQKNMEGMISGTVDAIAGRFDALQADLVSINEKLDRIETALETLPSEEVLRRLNGETPRFITHEEFISLDKLT
jgi:hypothetical protein